MHRSILTNALSAAFLIGAGLAAQTASALPVTVYSSNFSGTASGGFSNDASAFTGGSITTSPNSEKFLSFGGAGGFATLTLTGLGAHTQVALAFRLDVVGSMDGAIPTGGTVAGGGNGDFFTVTTGSTTLFNHAFANYGAGEVQDYPVANSAPGAGAASINGLGYTGFPAAADIQDAEYDFDPTNISTLLFADANGTLTIRFTDNSNEGAGNEFYGIDNLVVTTNAPVTPPPRPGTVPEPAPLALIGAGLVALVAKRRRR